MAEYNGKQGRWITYQGKHLFIEDGEDLVDKQDREIKANQKVAKELNDEKKPHKEVVFVNHWGDRCHAKIVDKLSVEPSQKNFVGTYDMGKDGDYDVYKTYGLHYDANNGDQFSYEAIKKEKAQQQKPLTKSQQLDIILKANPAEDDEHTWIREESDILTYPEAIKDTFGDEIDDITPDFTADDIKKALKTGKITVYSSKPIVNGNFVTPSAMEAASYSGNQQIYKATLNLADVAWIDEGQGQLATKNNIEYTKMSSKGLI